MQNDLWTGLAEKTQRYADMGDMRAFYEVLKAVFGPSHQIQAPLRSWDGSTLLTDKEAILQRWSERFEASKLGRFRNIFGNVCITENISTLLSCLRVIEGLPSKKKSETACGEIFCHVEKI